MSEWSPDSSELREREAVRWYRTLNPDAPHALDAAIVALRRAFGGDVDVAAVAPVDESTGEPSDLFLAVSGDISDDETWERLVEAYRLYSAARVPVSGAFDRLGFVIAEVTESRPLGEATLDWFQR